ncbi:uncharacterized protein PADG_00132 [Paracoccidioides brasiliensis Pb18]|uniref:Uncharacterized protein n=1 Tax=Paracoccidioides brasiliensis (strain Pb18) TaxID=502780 RepID=C1FZU2_PARBD|nr:uncharacterized protein PADG_00132 [Paracoccidioides brasiliensis Pb18]EEH43843.1 hypothetical protein PADG_00132 [Paracoccidioides brasiliensis Pb18]
MSAMIFGENLCLVGRQRGLQARKRFLEIVEAKCGQESTHFCILSVRSWCAFQDLPSYSTGSRCNPKNLSQVRCRLLESPLPEQITKTDRHHHGWYLRPRLVARINPVIDPTTPLLVSVLFIVTFLTRSMQPFVGNATPPNPGVPEARGTSGPTIIKTRIRTHCISIKFQFGKGSFSGSWVEQLDDITGTDDVSIPAVADLDIFQPELLVNKYISNESIANEREIRDISHVGAWGCTWRKPVKFQFQRFTVRRGFDCHNVWVN